MMWVVLLLASCCELAFTVFMKLSCGYTNKKYTILTIIASALSIFLLSVATTKLPLGLSYAIWTGLGTIFTVTFGIIVFHESRSKKKLFFMSLVLVGIIGLRLSGSV